MPAIVVILIHEAGLLHAAWLQPGRHHRRTVCVRGEFISCYVGIQNAGCCASQVRAPKLEIKKDIKGMVTVPGCMVVEVTSARELIATFEKGQLRRHTSETQVGLFVTNVILPHPLIPCSNMITFGIWCQEAGRGLGAAFTDLFASSYPVPRMMTIGVCGQYQDPSAVHPGLLKMNII